MNPYLIMLADDHVLVRQGLRRIIEEADGLQVAGEAGDGRELLVLLNTLIPHMVILDLSMPNLGGLEAIREIKTVSPEVKILILTMHKEYMRPALSSGANGYLLKQDADRELFYAIEKIREGEVFTSPRLAGGRTPLFEPLTLREKEVLKLIAGGKSSKKIGELLFISPRTVECHRAAILSKIHLKNTAELVKYAVQEGYV
jgi:DNA-binding NarL/FixJ family response regulator